MKDAIHEPLSYSSNYPTAGLIVNYIFIPFLWILSLVTFALGVYFAFLGTAYYIAVVGFISFSLGLFYVTNVPYQQLRLRQNYEYVTTLDEFGLEVREIHKKTGNIKKEHISFEDMESILVGNFVYRLISRNRIGNLFKIGALVIIKHGGGYLPYRLYKSDELEDWMNRFIDKNLPIYLTDYDLYQANFDHLQYGVDFSAIEGMPLDAAEGWPEVGKVMTKNPYPLFEDQSVEAIKEKKSCRKTKKAEILVVGGLFLYALHMGAKVMPELPMDADGFFEVTDLLLLTVILVNVIIPFIYVYWRHYTKWYMPFVYFVVVTIGNCLGWYAASIFSGSNPVYEAVIFNNFLILIFGWYLTLIIMKFGKVSLEFLSKHGPPF